MNFSFNWQEIVEQFKARLKTLWEQIRESSAFNQLKDRYENLSPVGQKAALWGGVAALIVGLFFIPMSYLWEASENLSHFEEVRNLNREMIKSARSMQTLPNIPKPLDAGSIAIRIQEKLKATNLYPEQIQGIGPGHPTSRIVPQAQIAEGIEVRLSKLNIHQILDVLTVLGGLGTSTKVKDVQIQQSQEDAKYMDFVAKLINLKVPDLRPPPPPPEPLGKGKKKKGSGDEGADEEGKASEKSKENKE